MNVKSLGPATLIPVSSRIKTDESKEVHLRDGADRDANGKQESGQGENHQSLTDEQWELALKKIKELAGVKANGLVVSVEISDSIRILLIKSQQGEVIRRLSESQLIQALKGLDRSTGQILDKAM